MRRANPVVEATKEVARRRGNRRRIELKNAPAGESAFIKRDSPELAGQEFARRFGREWIHSVSPPNAFS